MTTTQFRLFLKCTSSRAFIFCLSYFQFCLWFILPRTLDILLGQAMTVNLTPCKAKDTENLVGCFSMQIQLALTSFIRESTKMRRISVLVPNSEELFQLQILKAVSRCLYASRLLFKLPEMSMLCWHILQPYQSCAAFWGGTWYPGRVSMALGTCIGNGANPFLYLISSCGTPWEQTLLLRVFCHYLPLLVISFR